MGSRLCDIKLGSFTGLFGKFCATEAQSLHASASFSTFCRSSGPKAPFSLLLKTLESIPSDIPP